jgi:flotillin
MILGIIIAVVAVGLFSGLIILSKYYKRCPSDKVLVIYGKQFKKGKSTDPMENQGTSRCIHGGAAFVIPLIQDFAYLSLIPFQVEIQLKSALSKQNIRVDVPATFTIAVSTNPSIMSNAAERLLGLSIQNQSQLANEIIYGQLREVIATMTIEEIVSDRDKFIDKIRSSVVVELNKIGFDLINVNIQDIKDEAGYVVSLGKEAAARAINEAKISVAEQERIGEIGKTEKDKDRITQTSAALAQAEIGKAEADRQRRTSIATANATAVAGENEAKANIAKTDSTRQVAEAEARREAETAIKTADARILEDSYAAEQKAEVARAERDKASQIANVIVPTQVARDKTVIEANAAAQREIEEARGKGEALRLQLVGEAEGQLAILEKKAEGFKKLVEAAGGNAKDAVMMMIADQLTEITEIQVEAIKNLKIDKVVVWDNLGQGGDGQSSTAKFASSLMGSLPPFNELLKAAGFQLPGWVGNEVSPAEKDVSPIQPTSDTPADLNEAVQGKAPKDPAVPDGFWEKGHQ